MPLSNQALPNIGRQVYFRTFAMRFFDMLYEKQGIPGDETVKRLENGVAKR